MANQDTTEIKEKIILSITRRGPSLPIHISHNVGVSPLFAAAFLSELVSEQKLKISHMRVGNSPLYFLPGQEYMLERFSGHLKSKEKDAFLLLKDKKIIKDSEQHPAIRVALRSIRDFAVPFKKGEHIFWRYFNVPEVKVKEKSKKEKKEEQDLGIFEKEEKPESKKKKQVKKRKTTKKKNDIFFNKVKKFLSGSSIIITEVESLAKNELILKVKSREKENLLFAYNKKRITEADIIKASKKASELELPYLLLSKGGPLKKVENLIKALKNLVSIETLK